MEKFPIKNQSGFSLIEMTVAVAVFAFMIVAATGIFQKIVEGQRSTIAAQNIQEAFRYALEMMSKEIRNAQVNKTDDCDLVGIGNVYNSGAGGTELYFRNKDNKCVRYYLLGNKVNIERGADDLPITPAGIIIDTMKFIVIQNANAEPSVTMLISGYVQGKAMQKEEIKIQTTISSRAY